MAALQKRARTDAAMVKAGDSIPDVQVHASTQCPAEECTTVHTLRASETEVPKRRGAGDRPAGVTGPWPGHRRRGPAKRDSKNGAQQLSAGGRDRKHTRLPPRARREAHTRPSPRGRRETPNTRRRDDTPVTHAGRFRVQPARLPGRAQGVRRQEGPDHGPAGRLHALLIHGAGPRLLIKS